ncbi:hypothetical protein M430DRAFT_19391 [Amorphotheca resinae ATCC 22711]|jgi:NADPH:quinone reductase-like Zn-dependent oxidoreductase|uniref:Enoyl reductase (ER) domain-containing protein n=1 Tax=Amorphotheca resinae ATCC 22711 TaxID=857342 RepID=A0A2T3B2L4_AMORE|nr:hypothetical protein M430DRAFT_19391 [Amorphotheca resinae ATCC 22711]PSS18796.1 hypothetical protein M430DRAFT_19391 [Amorphotheca resinae ATCC 22711]
MPPNHAAWLSAKYVLPLEIKAAPYTTPNDDELVVRNCAIAINHIDWNKQALGNLIFSWIRYPFIMGSDLAGEVVEVGEGVTRFSPGDRVLALAVAMDQRSNKAAEGAFQEYTVVRQNLTAPIPDAMIYEKACVLPLCLSTAACALFQKDHLALQYPSTAYQPTGKTLLVWGGSTAVGSNAIQLAVAAGYEVVTTSSPKNFAYVSRLGARSVFNYRSPTAVKGLIRTLKDKDCVGAIAIGNGSMESCISIIGASKGRKFISQVSIDTPDIKSMSTIDQLSFVISTLYSNAYIWIRCKLKRVKTKFVFGSDLMANEVGSLIFEQYLPTALANGSYVAAPEFLTAGHGLERIQNGFDLSMRGVSARKVVVTL